VDSIATHNKMLETQISQVAQQAASSSKTSGTFPGQPEANLKGQLNANTLRNGRQLEDPVVKTKTNKGEIESEKLQSEKAVVESKKPKVPFPQRFAKPNLDAQFKKFINMLKKKYTLMFLLLKLCLKCLSMKIF